MDERDGRSEREQRDERDELDASPFVERPLLVRWLADGATFTLTRFIVLRLLGVVYFAAFAAAFVQGPALIGERGLLPMAGHVAAPSLFALSTSDAMLRAVSASGAVLSLAVVFGATNAGVMLALWILQLSLAHAGRLFWGYGWELQLCETGLIAAFLCPLKTMRPFASMPPTAPIWILRWLIVRIMWGAGLIKLRGDPCWRDLTCLVFHYETQPNPNPLSWLLHQAPTGFHTAGVLFNHFVELVVPFFMIGPLRFRRIAGGFLVAFQFSLIASGNLSFLNWLTIVPAIACFDDVFLARFVPRRFLPTAVSPPSRIHVRATWAFALVVGVLSVGPVANLLSTRQAMNQSFDPLQIVNTYGAFGSVTRVRNEIIFEGTDDEAIGERTEWKAYELPCKPGDPMRRPCVVGPWHYRLDWQMWFAAMSSYEYQAWILVFVDALLRGDPAIAPLVSTNPFADRPPRWVRAELYRYEFTRLGEGPAWWRRVHVGEYLPPIIRGDPDLERAVRAIRNR